MINLMVLCSVLFDNENACNIRTLFSSLNNLTQIKIQLKKLNPKQKS